MIDRQALLAAADGEVRFDEPMREHTTFRIGGPADALAFPRSVTALRRLVTLAHERRWPVYVIGNGSNLLVLDGGIRGLVIATTELKKIEWVEEHEVVCEAGVALGSLIREAQNRGLGGLSFLAGIPGTVGGAAVMNAGTPAGTFGNHVVEVGVVMPNGDLELRSHKACGFRYRGSDLAGWVVATVRLLLVPEEKKVIESAIIQALTERRVRQPHGFPCAGSIFKNPSSDSAGRLIDAAGLKGIRFGDAEVSPIHANFIVNLGNARAADVLGLMKLCQETVEKKFGVRLEPEVCIVGEEIR